MDILFTQASYKRNEEKNHVLMANRGVGFQEIILSIQTGYLLDCIPNPSSNHDDQMLLIVVYQDYIYAVPIVISSDYIFMKTIYPCRKYKSYLS